MTARNENETATVEAVVEALYRSISFPEGGSPDWELERRIFAPDARMTRMSETEKQTFTVDEYRANFERMMAEGLLPGFYEYEVAHQSLLYADLAHVWSTYAARRSPASPEILFRGINSIQLIRREGRWQIANVIWFREGAANPIPEEFLR